MGLSVKNGWLDAQGRVYIIFPVQAVMEALGCADNKATKLFRELEQCGLVERKRRGIGKPNLIYGVLDPLIARHRPDGDGYEIISGHRRQYAAKLAGLDTLPVIVRQMSDDAAVILMVDSNLQRENILPSERAFAYKMKLDALQNQGARSDLTSKDYLSLSGSKSQGMKQLMAK